MQMLDSSRTAPSAGHLQAAVEVVVSRLNPDQIILFGSAVRGEMTAQSDLDLLVITDRARAGARNHHRWWDEGAQRDIDAFVSTRTEAEEAREYAGNPRGAALETGRTIYTRPGFTAIETGRGLKRDRTMTPQSTLYQPDRAVEFLTRAERKWTRANQPDAHPADRCEDLQFAMEQALKALTIAQGRQIVHTHDLNALWDHVERDGERIPGDREKEQLRKLSLYAGIYQYENPTDGAPEKTWRDTRETGERVLEHARTKVPVLVRQTRSKLGETGGRGSEPGGTDGPTGHRTVPSDEETEVVVRGAGRPAGGHQLNDATAKSGRSGTDR